MDIPALVQHFLIKKVRELGFPKIPELVPGTFEHLSQYHWPGNVRELENILERAVVLAERLSIEPENLPPEFGMKQNSGNTETLFDEYSLKKAKKVLEEKLIIKALKETGGNRTHAAKLLEISHPSLLSKIKEYKITE